MFFIAVAIPVILLFGYITLPNCVELVPRQTVTSSFPLSKDFKDALRKGKLTTVNASGFEHWEDYYTPVRDKFGIRIVYKKVGSLINILYLYR